MANFPFCYRACFTLFYRTRKDQITFEVKDNPPKSLGYLRITKKNSQGIIRNEKAAQRVSFGAGYPADVRTDIPADVRGQKLRSGPRNPGKTSISVRTSMTQSRGRP